jgi:predicted aldo/keto reductase-like oxidoreductase
MTKSTAFTQGMVEYMAFSRWGTGHYIDNAYDPENGTYSQTQMNYLNELDLNGLATTYKDEEPTNTLKIE